MGAGREYGRHYYGCIALLDRLKTDTVDALKAGDSVRVGALRLVTSELQKGQKEAPDGDFDETAVLQRERKRRLEAAEAYAEAGRTDLAEGERREAEIIESYMPQQLSDEELDQIVGDAVAESGAASAKEMGKVMSVVMPRVRGRADGRRVSAALKEKLTG